MTNNTFTPSDVNPAVKLNIDAIDQLIAQLSKAKFVQISDPAMQLRYKNEAEEIIDETAVYDTHSFNLSRWKYDCGAPSCIAGHAVFNEIAAENQDLTTAELVHKYREVTAGGWFSFTEHGAELLGISYTDADTLFVPTLFNVFGEEIYGDDREDWEYLENHTMREHITPAMTVQVLKHLKQTGKVDWSIIAEDFRPIALAEIERKKARYQYREPQL